MKINEKETGIGQYLKKDFSQETHRGVGRS